MSVESAPLAPLPPGSTVGILGGGQLGRMLAIACARLGLHAHIYDPAPAPPAAEVARTHTQAGYDDTAALTAFAEAVDVATFEFENVPAAVAETLAAQTPVRPNARAFAVAQDRAEEKRFIESIGIGVAPWAPVDSLEDLIHAITEIGTPAILKTRRLGYDGKGQVRLDDPQDTAAAAAWEGVGGQPSVLEGRIAFTAELSVIVARALSGVTVAYDPGRNLHENGILRRTTVPAGLPNAVIQDAVLAAGRIASALDYVGVMGVEFFLEPGAGRGGRLLVNEIAPRVHNTGHWTTEACAVDQFEQHIRAVAGWPLGDGVRHADAEMTNLLGDEAGGWAEIAAEPGASLHLYGKGEARPGRKMGHVTRLRPLGTAR
ncbi:MAG: 5-(carboxyamino)imidazole ribonucleotide synthase [Pseudomonadota bacterium]